MLYFALALPTLIVTTKYMNKDTTVIKLGHRILCVSSIAIAVERLLIEGTLFT
ncbi:hypothetical protein CYANOKiyG1_67660 [Okeania sp. KiyG1]|nr:hypothetical protein CYANOKiyG1_67660 [Okeania sp. KiyG1]